jgi:hypothetical protein
VTDEPQQNTAIIDGVRGFYEHYARTAATEMPDVTWPAFDELTSEASRAWLLAYAATCEVAVRIADAMLTVLP